MRREEGHEEKPPKGQKEAEELREVHGGGAEEHVEGVACSARP